MDTCHPRPHTEVTGLSLLSEFGSVKAQSASCPGDEVSQEGGGGTFRSQGAQQSGDLE